MPRPVAKRGGNARLALVVGVALGVLPVETLAGCSRTEFRIVLDVGHSAAAPGATSARGVPEHAFNLKLTSVIERKLAGAGYPNVLRSAAPSGATSLAQRSARANALEADLFLSIHHDSVQPHYLEPWVVAGRQGRYSDRFRGWSLFVSSANRGYRESLRFASLVADALMARGLPFSRHHAERIPGESRSLLDPSRGIYDRDGLAVLARTRAPAVLLESGVIVNRDEELALSGPQRQNAISDAVRDAMDAYCTGTPGE